MSKLTLCILFRDLCKKEGRTYFDPETNEFISPDGTIVARPVDNNYIKLSYNSSYGGYQMQENGGSRPFLMPETRYRVLEMIAFIRGYFANKNPKTK